MNIYKLIIVITALVAIFSMTSCGDDFLSASSTQQQEAGGPATEESILSNLSAAYQPLLFDSFADHNYNGVLLMSDFRSDDLYKGGGYAGDQAHLYKLSQFTSSASETIAGLWTIYYKGLARSNNVLDACANAVGVQDEKLEQYKAEGHFLRAYYMHLLWKYWGNVPYFEEILPAPYMAKQYTADEIYKEIMEDLDIACTEGKMEMRTKGEDLARASRATALMLKARVVMYQKDLSRYAEVTKDMVTIINSGEFELMDDFDAMWLDKNEFCKESIFESNQVTRNKDWNAWAGYGTNLPAFISPSELNDPSGVFMAGWGFGVVRQEAYDMYENGDTRRDGSINNWKGGSYAVRFQDTGLFQRKYAARTGYNKTSGVGDLDFCNNLRLFRYAETLLNYVELVKMHGQAEQGISAQTCFDDIRKRAFGTPNPIPATTDNIKLERRREFLGEGMRFWDLIRWGDAVSVLTEKNIEFNSVRTFQEWMKYLPIPQHEMDRTKGTSYPLVQNGDWK